MKRKLIVLGDMRSMLKDTFGINDKEIDEVVRFMGEDYKTAFDVIKIAAKSDELTEHQKMVVSYIVGNTSGVMHAQEAGEMIKREIGNRDVGNRVGM